MASRTSYFMSLTTHLEEAKLLTDELKKILILHDQVFTSKPSATVRFGKYKGKTISEINEFDAKYLQWLSKQSWCFEDLKNEISNI